MSAATYIHTQGTEFHRGAGQPVAYTKIAGIQGANLPGKKRKTLDATTLDQPDNYMQKVGSLLIETEPVELEMLFDPDGVGQGQLEADVESGDPVPYRLKLRDGTTYDFNGLVTSFKVDGKMDDLYKAKVTIEISGKAIKTAGV